MDAKQKADLLRRVRTIAGHLRGVEKMIEDDVYCIEIIGQMQAVQSAISKVNSLILNDHLHQCVITAVRGKDTADRERVLTEIADVFAVATKR